MYYLWGTTMLFLLSVSILLSNCFNFVFGEIRFLSWLWPVARSRIYLFSWDTSLKGFFFFFTQNNFQIYFLSHCKICFWGGNVSIFPFKSTITIFQSDVFYSTPICQLKVVFVGKNGSKTYEFWLNHWHYDMCCFAVNQYTIYNGVLKRFQNEYYL